MHARLCRERTLSQLTTPVKNVQGQKAGHRLIVHSVALTSVWNLHQILLADIAGPGHWDIDCKGACLCVVGLLAGWIILSF